MLMYILICALLILGVLLPLQYNKIKSKCS